MAKGNLLQGMARGKVGDLVFSRMDGEQITRVRNRRPRNPKTNKQLYQRAIMATVSQLYAAGQEIFNHSFEGAATPADNQRRFMSENVKILRSLLANDLNTHATDDACQARFAAPGVLMPAPFPFAKCSDGSLPICPLAPELVATRLPEPLSETETHGDYLARLGFISNQLITIYAFVLDDTDPVYNFDTSDNPYSHQYAARFVWCQIQIKNFSDLINPVPTNNPLRGIFDVLHSNGLEINFNLYDNYECGDTLQNAIDLWDFLGFYGMIGLVGIVSSLEDSPKRSPSYLTPINTEKSAFGLTSNYVLDAWKRGAVEVGDSDYILEGGDSHPITPTPAPTPTPYPDLINGGYYAINIPLSYGDVVAELPIFVTYGNNDVGFTINMAVGLYIDNGYPVWSLHNNNIVQNQVWIRGSDIISKSQEWLNQVAEALRRIYDNIDIAQEDESEDITELDFIFNL